MAVLICGTVAPVLFSGSAYAAEKEDVDAALQSFELNPMVITAQRVERSDLDTPAGTSIITAEDIERSGAKTAYEIIERQIGFTNKAYGTGGREFGGSSSRIMLRGLDKGTLVLVNGTPLNLENYNSTEGIPAQAIEKIEIVRGAQAAMYGAEAVAGVINIITKKSGKNQTTISYGAGNFDQKWSVTSSGKNYMVYVSKDYYGDVNDVNRDAPQPPLKSAAKYKHRDSTKLNTFISVSPTDKLSLQYSRTEGKYYRDMWSRKNYELTGAGTSYLYDETRDNVSAIYDDKEAMFKSILSYNRRSSDPRSNKFTDWKLPVKLDWQASSNWRLSNITWDTQKGWNLRDGKDTLILGLDFQKESAKTWKNDSKTKKNYFFDGDRKSMALYASYKYQIAPKFSTTLGFRAMHVNDTGGEKINKILPQFSTLYKASDNASWYINIGKSFELPAVHDYFDIDRPDGVANVKAQEGWTYETGIKIANKSNSFKFDVFHMDIDGKFAWDFRDPNDKTTAYAVNLGKFKNTGVEMEYTQKFNDKLNMRLGVMLANPKAKDNDNDAYKQQEAKFQLTAGLDYQLGKLTTNLNYLYLGKRQYSYYNNAGNNAKTYGYDRKVPHRSLLNAAFTYKADEHNSMQLVFNNILGTDDCINEYESWSMPYNWMLTYNYTF